MDDEISRPLHEREYPCAAICPLWPYCSPALEQSTRTACSSPKRRACRRWPCSTTRSPSPSTTRWPSPASSRPSATTPTGNWKPPTSSPCPRAPPSTSSPCGSTARKPRANWSRPTRPARSTPPSSAAPRTPACSSTWATTCFRLRVFPIPPKGDQKVTLSYTAVASKDGNLVEYIYPLKTDGKATSTLEEFSITATIKCQHGVTNVYSPTHAITLNRTNDKEVDRQLRQEPGHCSTRTSSSSTPPATRTSA